MGISDIDIDELIVLNKIAEWENDINDDNKEIIIKLKQKWYIETSWTRYQKAILSQDFSRKIQKKWLYTKWKWLPKDKALMLIDKHIETFWHIKKSDTRDLFPNLTDDQRSNLLSRSWRYKLYKEWHASNRYYTKNNNDIE
jgi:hypothetical protein